MKKQFVFLMLCLMSFCYVSLAQSVGIGSDEFRPDQSAILELRSDTKGLLIPRLTSDQLNRINTPSTGLLVYQTDVNPGFYYFSGARWAPLLTSDNLPVDDDQVINFDPVSFLLTLENGGTADLSILRHGRSLESTRQNVDGTITFEYNDGTSFTTTDLRGGRGPTGPAGKDANTILTGSVTPLPTLGNTGDIYFDINSFQLYGPKSNAGWGTGNSLLGAAGTNGTDGEDGQSLLSGHTDPTTATGNNGDFYINTTNSTLFGPKQAGVWDAGTSLFGKAGLNGKDGADGKDGTDGTDGRTIWNGTINPNVNIGNDGDIYLNTTTFDFFGPKAGNNWGTPISLIGPKGADGVNGTDGADGVDGTNGLNGTNGADGRSLLHGLIDPPLTIGSNGDFYINTSTNELFGPKIASGWGTAISITGPKGADGQDGTNGANGSNGTDGQDGIDGRSLLNGTTPPTITEGNEGDFYIDTNAQTIYGPKTGSGWGTGSSIIGAAGTNGSNGTDGIDGVDGTNGTDGRTILNGTTNPAAAIGIDGDFYLDTNTQMLYGPKSAGAWPAGVDLVGVGIQSTADNPDGSITFNFTDGSSFTSQPDGDFSSSNELITALSLSGKTLQITESSSVKSIDLSTLSSASEITDPDGNTTISVDQSGSNDDIIRFTIAGTEALRINNRSLEFMNNLGTIAIGESAALNNLGAGNTIVGTEASFLNTSGRFNVALGYRALRQNTSGQGNIAIGYNAGFNETGSNKLYIDNSNTNAPLIWGDFSNDIANINGRLGIGVATPSNITNELEVNGSALVTSLTQTSDARLKKNIVPLTGSLSKILRLQGISYDWRTSEYPKRRFRGGRHIGFLAQELRAVFPQLVSQSADGFFSVSYSGLTPVLVEAIKEQQTTIDQLEQLLRELKADISATKKELAELKQKLK